MESKVKRRSPKKKGSIHKISKDVLKMIFDRVGYNDKSIISAQSVCRKWKTVLKGPCTNCTCPLSDLLSDALLDGNKFSVVQLLKHRCISNQTKMELLSASDSSKLHEIVNIDDLGTMREVLLTRACVKGQGEIVKVLLDKGALISTEALLNACKCIHYKQTDDPLKVILTYTGCETEEFVKLGLLRGLEDAPNKDFDMFNEISDFEKINLDRNNDEIDLLTRSCDAYVDTSQKCHWKNLADTLDEVLKSHEFALSMRNLGLTRAFIYLFKWESRFCTFYNYVQAYSTAIETRDSDFCFMLYQQRPEILSELPLHCVQHFVMLDWADIIELSIKHDPEKAAMVVLFSIQNNSVNSFRVAFNIALKQLITEDTIFTKNRIKEFLNTTALATIAQNSDKMLFSLLENEYVMQIFGKDEHIFLIHESLRRGLYTSLELLLELAIAKQSVYKIRVIAEFADLIVENLLGKKEYEVISKLLMVSYVEISVSSIFAISTIIRDEYKEDNYGEYPLEIEALKHVMKERIALFEFVNM